MITDLLDTVYPAVYDSFIALFDGQKPWLKTVEKLHLQITANPYSQFQIKRENRIAYGLAIFEDGGMARIHDEGWPDVQHAMMFAAQVCEIVAQATDAKGRSAYIKRIRGAFANPDELRAIRFEHLNALSFYRQGATIQWPEIAGGTDRFDILATDVDGNVVEVECKSCSPDKGRAITEQAAAQFFPHMIERLQAISKPGELIMVKVRVPKRLPTATADLADLATEVTKAILAGEALAQDDVSIECHWYDMSLQGASNDPALVSQAIYERATLDFNGFEGHRLVSYCHEDLAGYCVEVCSERSHSFFEAAWKTAKHAIQNQMTGTRPGMLVLRLEGLGIEALARLAEEGPNNLAKFATMVLLDERHQHLAGVAFVSDETVNETSYASLTPQSTTYVFDRPSGPYSGLNLGRNLFGIAGKAPRPSEAPSP
ncbi:hypothetical protein ACRCPS_17305 [Pseudomonas aeruginosa]